MIPLLLLSSALSPAHAQDPPPAHVTEAALEDTRPWEQRARALYDGPEGCVQLQGRASVTVAIYLPGGWLRAGERKDLVRHGSFEGTLDGGLWTSLEWSWDDEPAEQTGAASAEEDAGVELDDDDLGIDELDPLVGRIPPDAGEQDSASISIGASGQGTQVDLERGSGQALNTLDRLVEEIDPEVTTAYAVWEPASRSVVLRQIVPLDTGGDFEIQVLFPEGGAPTSLDAVFPRKVRLREGPLSVVIRDAQLHIRGQVTPLGVLPAEEGASLVLGALGFTIGYDQRISYLQARPCG